MMHGFFRGGGEYWAKVTPSSWKANLEHGLEWDWNSFPTNWFGHPFHGSLGYNSARSLGLTYWESNPYAFLNSFTWEYFGETHPPSGNDLMTTTLGGIHLGEITHRLSQKLYEYPCRGMGKIWRRTLGTLINPMGAFNRLVYGTSRDAAIHTRPENSVDDLRAGLTFGANFQLSSLNLETKGGGPFLEFEIIYGNPFQNKKFYSPFESFEFKSWLRFYNDDVHSTPFINISSHGVLWGSNMKYGPDYSFFIGAFQHFDYLHDEVIEIGSLGYSAGLLFYNDLGGGLDMYYQAHFGPSVLGGANNEIVDEFTNDPESVRDYILGPGFLVKLEFLLDHGKFGRLSANYKYFTFYVQSGPEGEERLNLITAKYSIPIWKNYRIGAEYIRYFRTVNYEDYVEYLNFEKNLYELRGFISYEF